MDDDMFKVDRRQIFEGACEVISRKGFGDASVREIAKAAGVSVPSLYQYVTNKEDILYMITDECMREIFSAFRSNMQAAMQADKKMEQAIADYIAYISKNRRYINLVYRETRSLSDENRAKIFELERTMMAEWAAIFDSGVDAGLFRPMNATLVANIFYFSCSVWALRYWAVGDHDEAEVRQALTDILMRGIMT